MSVRTERVASLVKHEIGGIFQKNFGMGEYGFITVTDVRMSPDLKIAKVYLSILGDETKRTKTFAMIEQGKSFVRAELGHNISLKYTPSLQFYLDETLDNAMNIEQILNKIHKESASDEDQDKE